MLFGNLAQEGSGQEEAVGEEMMRHEGPARSLIPKKQQWCKQGQRITLAE